MKRKIAIVFLLGLGLALAGFAWLWFAPCGMGGCAPVSDLQKYQAEGSVLLDATGEPFARLATVNRRIVVLDSLPEHLPQAFLAVEDRRFYDHGGVDWRRVGGALMANVRSGGVAEGGSTITMQLARNLFPDRLPYTERSVRRKVLEIRIARQIERELPKPKILELYLNHIYLGEGAYGVDAASREYFGKPAAELSVAEAALIAGLPKAPSQINPRADSAASLRRRDLVLRAMAEAGYLDPAAAEEARAEPLRLARTERGDAGDAPFFVEQVRRELEERVGDRFYTAGLRVHTTMDPVAQTAAEEELEKQLRAVEAGGFGAYPHDSFAESRGKGEGGRTPYLQGAVVVLDASNGAVRALVGGRDYDDSEYDRVFQALRQPGSAFKPFVYLTALDRGIPATRQLDDAPVRITLAGGRTWEPRNYTGTYAGPITLREALVRSKNTVAAQLAQEVGVGSVAATARTMGISSEIPQTPAVALGAAEVRPVELASAYAALANGGRRVEPFFVRRVETRDGRVLYEADPQTVEVIDPAAAFVLTDMLSDVVDRGTGVAVRRAGFRGPAAGKTGTTNDATDVWFAGYTPELVGVVWMGMDMPETIVRGASGGTVAAPVWGRIMSRIYRDRPMPGDWRPPSGVVTEEVDRATGLAVDAGCPVQGETYTEYFVRVRPARQPCWPEGVYPASSGGWGDSAWADTAWVDEEWGAAGTLPSDTLPQPTLRERGIYWPELEDRQREEGVRRVPSDTVSLPGRPVEPRTPQPRPAPRSEEPPRPAPAEPSRPAPAEPEPTPAREEPELLGRPIRPGEPRRPPPPSPAPSTPTDAPAGAPGASR